VNAETDRENLLERLREREQQMGRLMTLYVTTYQLHCTLDPQEVQSTIVDIVINLLGAESFVLFLRSSDGTHYEPVIVHTTDGLLPPPFDQERYQGGDQLVDTVLAEGSLAFGPVDGSPVLAAVALRCPGRDRRDDGGVPTARAQGRPVARGPGAARRDRLSRRVRPGGLEAVRQHVAKAEDPRRAHQPGQGRVRP
jgi:hypothetical protein